MKTRELTFTCNLGVFTFGSNVKLSLAKLLRDSVMARYFNPPSGQKRLKTEQDIYEFTDTLSPALASIDFDLELHRRR